MASSSSSQELTPRSTYRLMAFVALAMALFLGVAIFSFSRVGTAPWASSLSDPKIESTATRPLPQFEPRNESGALGAQNFEGKWTLLSFWSFTCPPCLDELDDLNQLALSWQGSAFQVITVNVDAGEDLELAKQFLQENEIVLPTVFDRTGELKKAFAVAEYPKHFLVNPDKEIVWEEAGAFRWNDQAARDQLLKLVEPQPETELPQDPEE